MARSPIRPVVGSDITDLSAFGGSIAELLRHGLVDDELQAPLIEYVLDGIEPTTEQSQAIKGRSSLYRDTLVAEPRLVLAALLALPDEAVERLAPAVDFRAPPTLNVAVRFGVWGSAHQTAKQETTLNDILACGHRWGWSAAHVVDAIVQAGFFPKFSVFADFGPFALLHASSILGAADAEPSRKGLWISLARLKGEYLAPFVDAAVHDTLLTDRDLREAARVVVAALPPSLAIPRLKEAIEAGSALQRQRAAQVLLTVLAPLQEPMTELLGWIEIKVEQESSNRARTELEQVRSALKLRSAQTIALPVVEFAELDLTDEEWFRIAGGDGSWASADQVRRYFDLERSMDHVEVSNTYDSIVRTSELNLDQRLTSANRVLLMLRYGSVHRNLLGLDESWLVEPLFISAVAIAAGLQTNHVFKLVSNLWRSDPLRWTSTQLFEWLSFHAIDIVTAIEDPFSYVAVRHELFELALSVEERPGPLHNALLRSAVTGPNEDRKSLWSHIDERFTNEVVTFLGGGQAERIGAAEWLGAHPSPAGVKALTGAAERETDDRVKAAMLTSLEKVGADLDPFLSPAALAATADNAMSKKSSLSKAIDWMDIDELPPLRWRNGDQVDSSIVRWFLHSAAKNKSATPSPIVRRHFSNMTTADAEAFGEALLLAWIDHDLAPPAEEVSWQLAMDKAAAEHDRTRRFPSLYPTYVGMSVEQIAEQLLPDVTPEFAGSARTSQGLLALVAVCGSPIIVDHARSYIRTHRGKRASQSKALIEMLAWMDDPSAIQTVMSMAHRYHPRALQQEAARQIEHLAEHRGWTTEQLADRSVPTGSFDQSGTLALDYGGRTFTASLTNDLDVTLVDDSTGRSIRSLPRGRADEDAPTIKHAKGTLKDATADIGSAVQHQPLRLRRAMATERVWTGADFQQFVLDHPVMLRLASRVLWSADVPDGVVVFRPLIDGTLITLDDDEFALDGSNVRIVHGQRLDPETRSRSSAHLRDYEVAPLISQLDPIGIDIAKGQRTIDLVAGSELSANLLASRARANGWQVADGLRSFVGVYLRFADLSLEAILAVDGGLHIGGYEYSDYQCRLGNLFIIESDSTEHGEYAAVDLGELSPVLLAEITRDVQSICKPSNDA